MGKALRWSDSFAVGHEAIDSEHRILVQLINDVDDAARANVSSERLAPLLHTLGRAVEDHFRTENSVLWELRADTYEGLKRSPEARRIVAGMANSVFDEHMAEHASLLGRFEEIVRASREAIGDMLKSWFIDHAVKQDAHLKAIFQAMR